MKPLSFMLRMRFWPCTRDYEHGIERGERAGAYHDGEADETDITTEHEEHGEQRVDATER